MAVRLHIDARDFASAEWNRIMETDVEDKLRAELLQKTQQLEKLKEACSAMIKESERLLKSEPYGRFMKLRDLIPLLKGML